MPAFVQSERQGTADRPIERNGALRERSRPAETRSETRLAFGAPQKLAVRQSRGAAHPGNENIAPVRASSASKVKQHGQPPLQPSGGYCPRPPLGELPRLTRGGDQSSGPTPRSTRLSGSGIAPLAPQLQGQMQALEQEHMKAADAHLKAPRRSTVDASELILDRAAEGVTEYVVDIIDHFFQEEAALLPRSTYMEIQPDINGKMRGILVDWLVEVHMKYKLRRVTLFLTIKLIDRYLSSCTVTRKKLQLIGVTALLVAAKFEEIEPPEVRDLVYITDSAYTKEDILDMERTVLLALAFQIVVPTEAHFLEPLMNANGCDDTQREVVQYLIELALQNIRMIRHLPSTLVAAAILLTNELSDQQAWPASMVRVSRLEASELRMCANEMWALVGAAPSSPLQAVRKKYLSEKHKNVARLAILTGPRA